MSVLVQNFSKPKRPLAGSIALALALSLANLPILSAEAAEVTATGCPAVDVGSSSNITYARTGDFCILEFTGGTNSFVPPSGVTTISLIVVAGGGGGGVGWGGGGGAGGVLSSLSYAVSAGSTYNLTVGSGGSGGGSGQPGTDGGNSSFSGLIATGGGGGAGYGWRVDNYLADGRPGGSGGGAAEENAQIALGGSSTQQSYTNITSYGNRGGNQGNNTGSQAGSGGGGAGGAGGDVPSNSNSSNRQPGAGGAGISITVGKTFNLAGGGGGASRGIAGAGGSAGGVVIGGRGTLENASTFVDDNTGINAVANTGSGGGGGMDGPGGNGSAGIVVIAFQTGGTPAYPGLTGPSSGLSGAIGAATSIGNSYSIVDSTSVGWSSVIARLSATQATLSATAAGSAMVSGAGTANLTITGSITDVQTTINSATFTKTNSTSGTLTLTVEPNSKFTSGGTTYYFWNGNGHYYRYLSTAAANNPSNQAGFLNYAMSTRFAGAGGYLLTVTGDSSTLSVEEERQEHDFIISTDILSLNKASQTYGPRAYTAGIRCTSAPATSATSCSGAVSSTFYWLPGPNAPLHERAKAIQNTTAGSYPWHSGGEPNQSARALAFSGWQTTADTFTRANTYTGTTETYTRAFMWDDFPHDSQFDGAVVEYGSNTSFAFTSHNQIQRELVASYTVTFNGNNNTSGSVPTSQTKTHNVDLTVPDNTGTLARNGYTFIGWNTAADGSGSSYAAGASYSSNSSVILYARWLPISPPTEVEATPGYQSVTVGWTAPESAASVAPTSYIVQYSTTGTGTWTTASSNIDSSARSYQITGLTIGTQYYVRVAAVYSGVVGAYGYPWTLIFESSTASRQADAIVYTSTNGLTDNDIDLSRTDFTRVRYYIGAKYASSEASRSYVDANFDKAITNGASGSETFSSLIRLQVPIETGGTQSQFEIQGNVSDLTVQSNVNAVTQGTNMSARLEIWPWNYSAAASSGLSGGSQSPSLYDDGDSWAGSGPYGSFQLHNIGGNPHTIFAWNRHFDAKPEIGFGNNTLYRSSANVLHPDWTFAKDSASYTLRTDFLFQSYANLSVTPVGTYTITFDGNGNTGGSVPNNQTKTHAVDLTVSTNSGLLVKSGYVFSGWNTSANGSGTSYAAGSTFSANANTTLYANWITASYGSVYFSGTATSYLEIANDADLRFGTGDFTIEWWQYQQSGGGQYPRVFSIGQYPASLGVSLEGGTFYFWNGSANAMGSYGSITDTWTHFAISRNGSTLQVFKNGVLLGSKTISTNFSATTPNLIIGNDSSKASNSAFKGNITSFHWVKGQAKYTANFTPETSPPAAISGFSKLLLVAENTERYSDSSGANKTVTNQGTTYFSMSPYLSGATTYTITFDGNGSTGGSVPANQTKTQGVDLTIATNSGSLVRAGYTFSGWNTSANGTGTTYAAGSTYSANAATSLYAQWSTNSLTITYNANGGSTPLGGSTTTLTGGTIASLPTTSYDGHSFVGWFTAVSGGLQVTTTSPHGQTENFTLFARWSADTYTITFDGNGNTGGSAPANQTKTHAVDLTVAGNSGSLVKSGYTFAGWNTSANGTGTSYAAESTYSANAATTLYAQWSTNSFTVTYDTQGGSSVTGVTTLTGGSLANPGTPTRAGYTFAGWFIGSSGGAALTFPYVHNQTSNFTLFAQWTANTYTVLYEYNGATANSSSASANYLTGGAGINLPNPTKTGYGFAGWFESSTLSGTAVSSPYTTTQNRTLYAKWTANNYSVSYSISVIENGETVTATSGTAPVDNSNYNIGQNLVVSANTGQLSRTGYVFAGWVTNSDGSGVAYSASQTITFGAANITLYPKWLPGTYTITYNKNGADGSLAKSTDTYTTQGDALTLPGAGTMSKAGYTFAGWSYTANGTAISNTSFTTSQNRTLYAVWTLANYTATYDLNGGSGGVTPSNQTANFETNITIASIGAATKDGHWFAGWNTAANRSGNSYGEGQVLKMPIGGLTLYAVWVPNTYRISYNSNGGAGGPDLSATDGFDTATFGESYNIQAKNNISRIGYTFTHWSTNVDGSGVKYESNGDNLTVFTSLSPLANTVFYAQWTANEYTFTFNPAGGNNSPVDQSKTFGQTITLPSAGTRTGYTLSGWSDGTLIYPASGTYLVGAASVNFEAIWTPNVYSVLFDWQGGIGNGTASASYTVGTGNLSLPTVGDVTRDGFTFAGWSTTEGGATSSAIQPASNTVLYAVWNSGNYTLNYEVEGGALVNAAATVARGGEANLPSPTRDGFVLEGWYTSANGGERVGGAGDTYTPARSRSLYARWVQRSLAGVDLATLDSASEFNASSTTGTDTTITHVPSSTSARVIIPAGALPNGTKVNVQYFKDTDRQSTLIPGENSYFFAVLVSWLYGSGSSATVPNTAAGKPILVTLRNDSIKAGAMVYMVIGTEVTEMGRATIDREVTVELTQDPELVVAATAPSAPTSVAVTSGDQSATISWSIPSTNGGSEIISYTVTASSGGGSCQTTSTSCSITGLINGQDYSFTVIATNSVGNSAEALSASVSPAVASYTVTFNSNGGSSVASGSFTSGGSVAEPSAPSRSGYTFNGWSTLLNNASSKVTFPYSPGTNANITLFALWAQIVSGSDSGSSSGTSGGTSTSTGGSSGSGGSQTTSPGTGAGTGTGTGAGTGAGGSTGGSDPKPGSSSSSQIGFIPTEPEESVHESGPVGSVEGTKEQAVFVRDSGGKQLSAEIGEVKLVIESGISGGSGGLVTQKLELSLNVGESAALSGNGLLPNTFIEIWVFSDPIYLGSIAVDADGEFASTVALPNSLLPGLHTMQIGTLNAEGKLVKLSIPLIVRGSVSVGTFKGFVAIYTKDLVGQNLSARVAGRWIRQVPIQNFKNFKYSRLVRFTGAGYNIIIDVFINQKFYKRFTTRTR